MFKSFGAPEILLILLVILLLFGAKKLPETARGLGRSMRIFKAETKGLKDDDKVEEGDVEVQPLREVEARRETPEVSEPVSNPSRDGVTDASRRDV
jgi:sec-independent protein translocase protein TatA